jgi:hypothetical protein
MYIQDRIKPEIPSVQESRESAEKNKSNAQLQSIPPIIVEPPGEFAEEQKAGDIAQAKMSSASFHFRRAALRSDSLPYHRHRRALSDSSIPKPPHVEVPGTWDPDTRPEEVRERGSHRRRVSFDGREAGGLQEMQGAELDADKSSSKKKFLLPPQLKKRLKSRTETFFNGGRKTLQQMKELCVDRHSTLMHKSANSKMHKEYALICEPLREATAGLLNVVGTFENTRRNGSINFDMPELVLREAAQSFAFISDHAKTLTQHVADHKISLLSRIASDGCFKKMAHGLEQLGSDFDAWIYRAQQQVVMDVCAMLEMAAPLLDPTRADELAKHFCQRAKGMLGQQAVHAVLGQTRIACNFLRKELETQDRIDFGCLRGALNSVLAAAGPLVTACDTDEVGPLERVAPTLLRDEDRVIELLNGSAASARSVRRLDEFDALVTMAEEANAEVIARKKIDGQEREICLKDLADPRIYVKDQPFSENEITRMNGAFEGLGNLSDSMALLLVGQET